jgi:hypothetical protein
MLHIRIPPAQDTNRPYITEQILEKGRKKLVLDHLIVKKMDDENLDTQELSNIIKCGAMSLFNDDEAEKLSLKYDNAAVDKLLDRNGIIQSQPENEGDTANTDKDGDNRTSFSFAKVWTLEDYQDDENVDHGINIADILLADGGTETQPSTSSIKATDSSMAENHTAFWDQLLKERIENAENRREEREKGAVQGKRRRTKVSYNEGREKKQLGEAIAEENVLEEADNANVDPDFTLAAEEEASESDIEFPELEAEEEGVVLPAPKKMRKSRNTVVYRPNVEIIAPTPILIPTTIGNLDPKPINGYEPSVSCWLCSNPRCRLRSKCIKANDAKFLRKLKSSLKGVPNSEVKVKIIDRLLHKIRMALKAEAAMKINLPDVCSRHYIDSLFIYYANITWFLY